jgi:hypothetical protein
MALGSGANIRLAQSVPPPPHPLREASRYTRSLSAVGLCSDLLELFPRTRLRVISKRYQEFMPLFTACSITRRTTSLLLSDMQPPADRMPPSGRHRFEDTVLSHRQTTVVAAQGPSFHRKPVEHWRAQLSRTPATFDLHSPSTRKCGPESRHAVGLRHPRPSGPIAFSYRSWRCRQHSWRCQTPLPRRRQPLCWRHMWENFRW